MLELSLTTVGGTLAVGSPFQLQPPDPPTPAPAPAPAPTPTPVPHLPHLHALHVLDLVLGESKPARHRFLRRIQADEAEPELAENLLGDLDVLKLHLVRRLVHGRDVDARPVRVLDPRGRIRCVLRGDDAPQKARGLGGDPADHARQRPEKALVLEVGDAERDVGQLIRVLGRIREPGHLRVVEPVVEVAVEVAQQLRKEVHDARLGVEVVVLAEVGVEDAVDVDLHELLLARGLRRVAREDAEAAVGLGSLQQHAARDAELLDLVAEERVLGREHHGLGLGARRHGVEDGGPGLIFAQRRLFAVTAERREDGIRAVRGQRVVWCFFLPRRRRGKGR